MMLEPSIDSLLEKIPSKYTLVAVSAKRARQLTDGAQPLTDADASQKYVGLALKEINEGKLGFSYGRRSVREVDNLSE